MANHFEKVFGYDATRLRADPEGVIRAAAETAPFETFLRIAEASGDLEPDGDDE